MRLTDKLARLPGPGARAPARAAHGATAEAPGAASGLQATRRTFAEGAAQGRVPLSTALGLAGDTLALLALDEALAGVDTGRMLFVDTETTGLQGGAGTLPFLIGLGWYEGGAFCVEQLFLPRPGLEAPMLGRLTERLAAADLLVTYNGKCFDWPLLRARLVMNRLKAPAAVAHLDLLHCARRVFRRRLPSTRLQDLERRVLDFHRVGDIDGADIPQVYFDYLRAGPSPALTRVLEHNVHDIVSMAAVLGELARRVAAPAPDDAAEDTLALAEVHLRAGRARDAEALALAAARRAEATTTALDAWCLAARLAHRRRDWPAAAERLGIALALPRLTRADAKALHLALARVFEHHLKDGARALQHAQRSAGAEDEAAHARRLARLTRAPAQRRLHLP